MSNAIMVSDVKGFTGVVTPLESYCPHTKSANSRHCNCERVELVPFLIAAIPEATNPKHKYILEEGIRDLSTSFEGLRNGGFELYEYTARFVFGENLEWKSEQLPEDTFSIVTEALAVTAQRRSQWWLFVRRELKSFYPPFNREQITYLRLLSAHCVKAHS